MKIALVQYSPAWEDKDANKQKIISMIDKVEGADLLVFPEMTLTGFTMKSKEMSETIQGDSFRFFASIAREKSTNIFAGIIERRDKRNYNTLIHIKPDGNLLKLYRKIHPFSYSGENKNYYAGVKPASTKIKNWKIGLTICYDLRFPELFRKYGKKRAHLIVNIANWPDTRIEHWRTLLKARAIENQCYVAGVNRAGKDPKLNYVGFSSVFDPMGKEIIAVENEEKVILVELEKNYVNEVRTKFPFLDDIKLI
ncbi:MAG TPA: carbon-nitrogen family hydrolase [Ignavibacteriaceae bacterium]